MISNVFKIGGSFHYACHYICQDLKHARVLDSEGVRAHHHKLMAKDFECQREMRLFKPKPVFHAALTFCPEENPEDKLMVELARKYLQQMGLVNTQYVVVRHTDKSHPHFHMVANLVNNQGRSIEQGWNMLEGKRIAQELTEEYKLVKHLKKNLALTHRERLWGSDVQRYAIYEAISLSLPNCKTLLDLEKELLLQGIGTRIRYEAKTGKRLGISFRMGDVCFKGGLVDPSFSLGRLENGLRERLELEQAAERKVALSVENERRRLRIGHHF